MSKELIFPTLLKVGEVELTEGGLTKREYFALQILLTKSNQGLIYRKEAIQEADHFIEELESE